MFECFYIVTTGDGWYRLHFKDTHYCLACGGDLKVLLMTVKRLVKKYRTKFRLVEALSELEDGGKVSEKMFEVYEEDYKNGGSYFSEVVRSTVEDALKEVKSNRGLIKIRKRLVVG